MVQSRDYIDTGFLAIIAMTRGSPYLQALNKSEHNFRMCFAGATEVYKNIFLSSFVSELLYQVHKHGLIRFINLNLGACVSLRPTLLFGMFLLFPVHTWISIYHFLMSANMQRGCLLAYCMRKGKHLVEITLKSG